MPLPCTARFCRLTRSRASEDDYGARASRREDAKGSRSPAGMIQEGKAVLMFDLASVQAAIQQLGFDGWLLYDFRGLNILARRVIGLNPEHILSRRWFYFVPAHGEPRKLVHKIEPAALDAYPGSSKIVYLRWQELEAGVAELVKGAKRVAMEYVPRNANPYVSRVDAGTVELVRSCGVEVVPSGDLVQQFEATWDDEQWAMHREAARHTRSAYDVAFGFI